MSGPPPRKIVSLEQAAALVRTAQAAGEAVVMCHGCFDIVHPGHIRHLQHAARLGGVGGRLLVTITGDSLLDKGANRPLIPQDLRAENLAALDCVDWVAINRQPTAAEILELLRPDVYVKGREYEHNRDPRFLREKAIVEGHGGRVVFSSGDVVFSSTALIRAMEEASGGVQAALRQVLDQHQVTFAAMEAVIDRFAGKRVLVIGEAIRDTYVMCERPAIAGEGPMLTLRPMEYRSFDGGAAIIARHIAAMTGHTGEATMLTAMPRSVESEALRARLASERATARWIETHAPMIEKQRFLVGAAKVMKLDLGGPITLDATEQGAFIDQAAELAKGCDAVIIADFGQGLFTDAMLARLCERLRALTPLLAGDVSGRRSNLMAMRGMELLCPSEAEIRDALHEYDEGLSSVAWRVMDATGARALLATLGEEGLIAFERRHDADSNPEAWQTRINAQHLPALTPYALDQLGCGDALLAAATLTLAAGGSLVHAGLIGSVAAAVEAQRLGNAVIGASDLRRGLRRVCEAQLAWHDAGAAFTVEVPLTAREPAHAQLRAAHAQSS